MSTRLDITLSLALGAAHDSKVWKNKKMRWSHFLEKIAQPRVTNETVAEYDNLNKSDRAAVKDVGCYFGGYLRGGSRGLKNVTCRSILTLDVDFASPDFWEDFTCLYSCEAVLHSTHSNRPSAPRYRLIIPIDREVSPEEYQAISRRVAGDSGIGQFDNTTFDVNRFMYWGSRSKDGVYVFEHQEGEYLSADEILGTYREWTDSAQWPMADGVTEATRASIQKQEKPETKKGLIGAFCRTYTMSQALEKFLSEEYEPTAVDDRWTYKKGSTAAGLVIYDEDFAYCHHGTSPVSGKLCNVYDLVRMHLFGNLDNAGSAKASTEKMNDLVKNDGLTKETLATEKMDQARQAFGGETLDSAEALEEDLSWMKELEVDSKGLFQSSAKNIKLIMSKDPRLSNKLKRNEFEGREYMFPGVPWRNLSYPQPLRNVDFSGLRQYLEIIYGIQGRLKIEDAMLLASEAESFHPVREYLESLRWDGFARIDTLLMDYFGTPDTSYHREAIAKPLVAAVARIFEPGTKFDLVLVLLGKEGTYKSAFIKSLGKQWSSDSLYTIKGKDAFEQVQGTWLVEMAELACLRQADLEAVKHFITKQEDAFRPAFGRTKETFKRQCVFVGTTNNTTFLTGDTGNRRFIPVEVDSSMAIKNVMTELDSEVDQIWAEAVVRYRAGEQLFMSKAANILARAAQNQHSETDERKGAVELFLETPLPPNWDDLGVFERRQYLDNPPASSEGLTPREFVSVPELWTECLGQERKDMNRYKTRDINSMMRSIEGWEFCSSTRNFKIYGKQKYYKRIKN